MKKWWKKFRKNHKGFTLVELICTIAIFSIVISGVGSAMVISARSYRNGNVELDLQQQAQITSNLLTNLILDADKVVDASGSTLKVEKIESGVTVTYVVYQDGDQIVYQKGDSTPQTLAEHVTGFTVNNNAGNDNVDFTLQFTEGGRTYASDYHVTPRNGVTAGGASMSGTAGIYVENKLILEPGQTYDLNVRITGTSIQGFSIEDLTGSTDTTGTTVSVVDTRTAHITVGTGETGTGSNASFRFRVVADDHSAAPQDVEVLVRRVNAVSVNGYKTGGSVNKAGAVYKITANLAGTNLEKEPGAWYDVDYVNPYTAEWTFEYNGTDDSGNSVSFDEYFEVTSKGVEGNIPYVIIRSKQDLAKTPKLVVTCTALHPKGTCTSTVTSGPVAGDKTNKTGTNYGTVTGVWELGYSAWKRNGKIDIAVGELSSGSYWIGADSKKHYAREAKVTIETYNYYNEIIETNTMNSWTNSVDGMLTAVTDVNNIMESWQLVLDPERPYSTNAERKQKSYSTPYLTTYPTLIEGSNYVDHYNIPGVTENDPYRFVIKVEYEELQEDESWISKEIQEEYIVEDVSILYRNSTSTSWKRDNKIFVTEADAKTEYKVYFMFDKGWEGTDYYFHDSRRFVGVIHDDDDDLFDIRRDIDVVCPKSEDYSGGDTYITFSLTADEKKECLELSKNDDGIIKEIYEYNPLLQRLAKGEVWEQDENWNWIMVGYKIEWGYPAGYPKERWDQIDGCDGTVLFCFKTPNVTTESGIALKAMYCPTIAENDNNLFYYIDDITRYLLGDSPEYQEWNGSGWVSTYRLTRNDDNTGWIATPISN